MDALRQLIYSLLRLFGGGNQPSSSDTDTDKPVAQAGAAANGPTDPFPPETAKPGPDSETEVTTDPFGPADTETPAVDPAVKPLAPLPIEVKEVSSSNKNYIVVSGGSLEVRFRRHKKGLYTIGKNEAAGFIENQKSRLQGLELSDSAMRVMFPVSKNEGNLDAINTWDNSFLTFGMFQWTIGSGENRGELPALIKKVKEREPEAFREYFGQYGLDISEDTDNVYGYFSLDGIPVKADSRKEKLRTPHWSFRFWHAGQDPRVMAIEIEHAISRLKTFYWKQKYGVEGRPIAEVITSEYGVALVLDNHVNRPGYVDNCLRLAVKEAGMTSKAPENWNSEDERKVLKAYTRIRETYGKYPMTHAAKRAEVTRSFVEAGTLSDERGSFIYEAGPASRSLDPADRIGLQPSGYQEQDYEDIMHFDLDMEARGLDQPEEIENLPD